MKIRFWNILATVVAFLAMGVTLIGYFIPTSGQYAALTPYRFLPIQWAIALAAVAVCLGVLNLFTTHMGKLLDQSAGWPYSIGVLLGLATSVVAGALSLVQFAPADTPLPDALLQVRGASGPTNVFSLALLKYVQTPIGAALGALMFFFLVMAAFRILRRRPTVTSITFIITVVLALIFMSPWLVAWEDSEGLRGVVWTGLVQVCAIAGARGLLLGIALGTIAAGLRVLLFFDRPYGD